MPKRQVELCDSVAELNVENLNDFLLIALSEHRFDMLLRKRKELNKIVVKL